MLWLAFFFKGHKDNHTSCKIAPFPFVFTRRPVLLSFLCSPFNFFAGGDLQIFFSVALKCWRLAIGIVQKRGPRSAQVNGCDAYGRLLCLREEKNFVGRECVCGVGVALQQEGRALHSTVTGHIWLLATASTAQLPTGWRSYRTLMGPSTGSSPCSDSCFKALRAA